MMGIRIYSPPQNMLLWHNDYFQLKAIKKLQTQKELPVLPLSAYKQESISRCEDVLPHLSLTRRKT